MITFLRKYPLFKVIVLNVLAVLTYDSLRHPSTRATLLTAVRTMTAVQSSAGEASEGELPLAFPGGVGQLSAGGTAPRR